MPKRRIVIPAIVAMANELNNRGERSLVQQANAIVLTNRYLDKLKIKKLPVNSNKLELQDKIAKFKFLCAGGRNGD